MGNTFSARPADMHDAARNQALITDIVRSSVSDFIQDANRTANWFGIDDSLARELGPKDEKERHGTEETGAALMDAVGAMARVVNLNGNVIQNAQNQNNEDIHNAGNGRH